ncbi:MAG: tetratricopeptide repeat protein [Rubrivivax sp.]|nr:tetratricopeptide repeat protein [Rubrivivax sp.]
MSKQKIDMGLLQALYRAGRYQELEARAQVSLAAAPAEGKVWHLLGLARLAQGQLQAALPAFHQASRLLPQSAQVWSDLAVCLNSLGDRQAAGECFQRSLALVPQRAEVWAQAGRNAFESARYLEAERCCRQALALQPDMAEANYNLAQALAALGRHEEALVAFHAVLALSPNDAMAHNAVALGLMGLGRHMEALAVCRKALALNPALIEANLNLGGVLSTLGRYEEAVAAYRRTLELAPDLAEAHNNLANTLWELGRTAEAVAAYRRALQIRPKFAEALCNLANALGDLSEYEASREAYRQALEVQPDNVEAHLGLADVLVRLKQPEEAAAVCGRALQLAPTSAKAHARVGAALQEADYRDQAVPAYRRAIELKPGYVEAYTGLGNCLMKMGRLEEALQVYRNGLQACANDPALHSNLLFALNYLDSLSPEERSAEARIYGERVASRAKPCFAYGNAPDPARRLRVGFVSGDFGEHPVGYFLVNVVEKLNGTNLDLFAYETYKRKGDLNRRLRSGFAHWRDASRVKLDDEAFARQIREDGIDILVDLAGHTAHNRLPAFAWKPAPVQLTYLGYFDTTGLAAMDYILGNRWLLPESEAHLYTEKYWWLPDAHLCFSPPDVDAAVGPLPAEWNGYVTFGCFNKTEKLNSRVIACWAKLLNVLPGSRLFLKARALGEPKTVEYIQGQFAAHGIEPARLCLEGQSDFRVYLESYNQVDIALDPYPYNGGTTTVQSLWMGVPVLSLRGDRYVAHMSESILHTAGLPEWVAQDEDDYVAKAVAFASDLPALAELRAGLRQRLLASPICDAPRFARNLETAFREMWRIWCEQQNRQ